MKTKEELQEYLQNNHKRMTYEFMEQLVEYCRNKEREFWEKDGYKGGLYFLQELLDDDIIKTDLYNQLREVIIDYNRPYKIEIQ